MHQPAPGRSRRGGRRSRYRDVPRSQNTVRPPRGHDTPSTVPAASTAAPPAVPRSGRDGGARVEQLEARASPPDRGQGQEVARVTLVLGGDRIASPRPMARWRRLSRHRGLREPALVEEAAAARIEERQGRAHPGSVQLDARSVRVRHDASIGDHECPPVAQHAHLVGPDYGSGTPLRVGSLDRDRSVPRVRAPRLPSPRSRREGRRHP